MTGQHARGARRGRGTACRDAQRGSAIIEYAIVAFLAIVVLVSADENVVQMVMDAIRTIYRAFTSALAVTYPPVF